MRKMRLKQIQIAVGLVGTLVSLPIWAALPTPVSPSTGPPAGDWIALIKGYIKDGGLVLGLAIAVLGFLWVAYLAFAKFNEARQGKAEWAEVGVHSRRRGAHLCKFLAHRSGRHHLTAMTGRDEILANRLNAEPPIFKGCASSELAVIVGVAALVWLPVCLLLAGAAGALTIGFGLAGAAIVVSVMGVASFFQRFKRNRPDGYYQQRVILWLHDRGLKSAPFVRRSGAWDIGRTSDATLPLRNR